MCPLAQKDGKITVILPYLYRKLWASSTINATSSSLISKITTILVHISEPHQVQFFFVSVFIMKMQIYD